MRRRQSEPESGDDINLTPMLDVVFIMLIFFIVTATFVKEPGVEINRPETITASEVRRASILIAINSEGEFYIDNAEVQLNEVRSQLERLIAENPKGELVIQTDTQSESGVLSDLLAQIQTLNVDAVYVSSEEN